MGVIPMWHGYFGIETLELNQTQRDALVDVLKMLGPKTNPQPACLCHWRIRIDGQAAIFEALFSKDALTVASFKTRLGTIFGVDPTTIDHTLSNVIFAEQQTPIVVFSRGDIDYLRMALFGGPAATWEQSRIEVLAYLAASRAEWEPEVE